MVRTGTSLICRRRGADEGFRRAGQALWPEKFPLSVLSGFEGSRQRLVWSSLYQQKPSAAEGTIFKREWFCYYREQPRFKRLVQSVDTAFKVGADNDYSAITTWGVGENGFYLVWFWRDKAEFPELKRKVKSLASAYSPNQILVEDRASGQSLVQELKAESRLPIVPIKVDTERSRAPKQSLR